jgi:hypothetical protein
MTMIKRSIKDRLDSYITERQLIEDRYRYNVRSLAEQSGRQIGFALSPIFEAYPQLTKLYWSQFTPYFDSEGNHEFAVNSLIVIYRDEEIEISNPPHIHKKMCESISEVINSIPAETMKTLFGDHVQVTLSYDRGHYTCEVEPFVDHG